MKFRYPRKIETLPRIWLMTDRRNDDVLEEVISRLPRASGIIFRHYHLDASAREARFKQIWRMAKRKDHSILLADSPSLAHAWRADGVHGRDWKHIDTAHLIHSAPVHNMREINQAKRNGADIFFLSPAAATRSHPGMKPLTILQLKRLAGQCGGPVILLGGMSANRFRHFDSLAPYGWAAIDGLSNVKKPRA